MTKADVDRRQHGARGQARKPSGGAAAHAGEAPDAGARPTPSADTPSAGRPRQDRGSTLDSWANALGKLWAQQCREALHRAGRAAEGGWPGTLSEAHTRLSNAVSLERAGFAALTRDESTQLARAVCASARLEWRAHLDIILPREPANARGASADARER